jgi:tetratricopeptide (TPR) repeat protein
MMAKHSPFLALWVPAISLETFEIAYREIGILLRIPGISDDNADVKQLVKNSLNSGDFRNWLMIVDNADDPSVLLGSTNDDSRTGRLYDYLPHSDWGSILFTTRGKKVAERLTQSSILELEDMTKAEAEQLLAQRIIKGTLLDDQSATSELLELLTYLPLAIVQAIAFINSNQVSISDYVSLFKRVDTEVEILGEHFEDPSRYQETESTIARTWQISFDQILKQDQLAADYLSFIACVDRINIPQSLFPIEGTAVQRLKALGTLTGYAFIVERQQDSQQVEGERFFNVHRLVQKATIWWLKEHNDWTAWTETAYDRLEELIPYGGHEGRSKWINYLPHAIHIANLHSTMKETRRALLLDRIGQCQNTLGQYAAAEGTHRRVLSLRRKNLGNKDMLTFRSMNKIGVALLDQGKYKEAESINRQTLVQSMKVLGLEHPDTLMSMSNLAIVLYSQGKYEEAELMNRQELVLSEKVLGPEDPDTLISMNNLALVLNNQGRYEEAELMNRQILSLSEKVLGPEHPNTLTGMNNLVLVLGSQGKYEEAELMNRQILSLLEKVLGPEHPDTLINMNNLARVLERQGKYQEAELINRQTLAQKEKVLGLDHTSTLASVYCLAYLLAIQHQYDESLLLYKRVCAAYNTVLGIDHPITRACKQHYSEMLASRERSQSALSPNIPDSK